MSRTAKTVAWNTFVQGLAKALSLVLSLGVTMLLTRHLGVAGYGSFVAVFVYMTFFASFADWGTQTILIRELAREPASFERQVGAALTLRLGLSLSAALVAAATVPIFYSGQPQVLVGVVIALPTLLFGSISSTVVCSRAAWGAAGREAGLEAAPSELKSRSPRLASGPRVAGLGAGFTLGTVAEGFGAAAPGAPAVTWRIKPSLSSCAMVFWKAAS